MFSHIQPKCRQLYKPVVGSSLCYYPSSTSVKFGRTMVCSHNPFVSNNTTGNCVLWITINALKNLLFPLYAREKMNNSTEFNWNDIMAQTELTETCIVKFLKHIDGIVLFFRFVCSFVWLLFLYIVFFCCCCCCSCNILKKNVKIRLPFLKISFTFCAWLAGILWSPTMNLFQMRKKINFILCN